MTHVDQAAVFSGLCLLARDRGPGSPLSSAHRCLVLLPVRAADTPACCGFLVGREEQQRAAGRVGVQRLLPLPGEHLGVTGPRSACVCS